MSITTKGGDRGETSLMYGRRAAKSDIRIAAYGSVDELTSALGMARAAASGRHTWVAGEIASIQDDLIALMGEMATDGQDISRYAKDGYPRIGAPEVERLTDLGIKMEKDGMKFKGWIIPGAAACPLGAALDFARAVSRRTERDIVDLAETEPSFNDDILRYLNRLSDVLWLMARKVEQPENAPCEATAAVE
jgi:cob(I)alamin adenosyltransferase